jgi:hypothetical protein
MSRWFVVALVGALSVTVSQGFASPAGSRQQHHWQRPQVIDQSDFFPRPYPDYTGWSRSPGGGWVYFGSSYTFVPHRGIVDEACNLPSSACPNSQRANY